MLLLLSNAQAGEEQKEIDVKVEAGAKERPRLIRPIYVG